MWKMGSMGHSRGWHFGQAHDMMEMMHHHYRNNGGFGWGPDAAAGGIIGSFLDSFAGAMGERAAAATGLGDEGPPDGG